MSGGVPHRVTGLCLPGLVAFDLTAPAQVFASASAADGTPHYEFSTCSVDGGEVRTTSGFGISPAAGLEALARADTVVVPGYGGILEPPPAPALAALRAAAARGARVASVCTGAFALAHAGLLDGRRATTHWGWAGELAARFPAVTVDAEALYVDAGTGAHLGRAQRRDRPLPAHRPPRLRRRGRGQGRAADGRAAAPRGRPGAVLRRRSRPPPRRVALEPTRRWAEERLGEPLDVAALARHAGVSPRTFARRFRAEAGTTPLQWLLGRRVLAARRLLESSELPVEDVAWRCGFGTAASLRDHFRRATATTPTAYRRSFRVAC